MGRSESVSRLGVFTSGGDAPGMNACIRAVVRTAIARGLEVVGLRRGFAGILEGDFVEMGLSSVSNVVQHGGTILKSSRCREMYEPVGRQAAAKKLRERGIDALVPIGGDGTFHGAHLLWEEHGVRSVGTPGTIDADLFGSDSSIGFDTAVNTALDAIDKLRDTAESHDRLFFVEVMGRHAGYLALEVGIAGGAEAVLIPERAMPLEALAEQLLAGKRRGKTSHLVVVAEGDQAGGAFEIAKRVGELAEMDYRVCILGHVQRGGSPTARDRVLASRLGAAAVDALLTGETDKMAGEVGGQVVLTPYEETWVKKKPISPEMLDLAGTLAM